VTTRAAPWRWALWELPRRLQVLLVGAGVLAVVLALATVPGTVFGVGQLPVVGTFLLTRTLVWRFTARRPQRRLDNDPDQAPDTDTGGAAASALGILLGAVWALPMMVVDGYQRARLFGRDVTPYKIAFNLSNRVICTSLITLGIRPLLDKGPHGALLLEHSWRTPAAVALAVAVDYGVEPLGVLLAIRLASGAPPAWRVPYNLLAVGVTLLPVIYALVWTVHPVLVPCMVPMEIVLREGLAAAQLRVSSTTDDKTGLLQPAAWQEAAEEAAQRCADSAEPVAVLLVDLDHFKRVNDVHGHLAGDQVLQAVAVVLRERLTHRDRLGRFGGEEFVICLPGAGAQAAFMLAQRLRQQIGLTQVEVASLTDGEALVHPSASVGVAASDTQGTHDVTTLLAAADAAMYLAKQKGRNRAQMAPATRDDELVLPS